MRASKTVAFRSAKERSFAERKATVLPSVRASILRDPVVDIRPSTYTARTRTLPPH